MLKLGIIGGVGPESTIDYYRLIINLYRDIKKDGNQPEMIINSINMKKMLDLAGEKNKEGLIDYISGAVKNAAAAGAQYAVIASNTPHIVYNEVKAASPIPMISIVEETCKKAAELGLKKVGLLGTRLTMQADYYQRVFDTFGIRIVVPGSDEQEFIHSKIISELQAAKIFDTTRRGLLRIVKNMIEQESINGVILGCTELPLILNEDEYGISFLNTASIHVQSAVNYGIRNG